MDESALMDEKCHFMDETAQLVEKRNPALRYFEESERHLQWRWPFF